VNRGGPWIQGGVAVLVAPFVNGAQPSEAVLDTVRLWVRFYDVPWNKQTEVYGRLIGSKLGKVVEVDVDADGIELSDHLWVRIDWPLKQRLLARFKTNVKGQEAARIYPMQYERVPFFCFHCGLIGHSKEQCERIVLGAPSIGYDATLRCSPKRKYEGRAIATEDTPVAKRNLGYNSPAGSVNSSSLGRPRTNGRTSFGGGTGDLNIPTAVDANDGFEGQEQRAPEEVEMALATTVNNMQLQASQTGAGVGRGGLASDQLQMPGDPQFVVGGGSGTVQLEVAKEAMQFINAVPLAAMQGPVRAQARIPVI
jgi:hypothetical protein